MYAPLTDSINYANMINRVSRGGLVRIAHSQHENGVTYEHRIQYSVQYFVHAGGCFAGDSILLFGGVGSWELHSSSLSGPRVSPYLVHGSYLRWHHRTRSSRGNQLQMESRASQGRPSNVFGSSSDFLDVDHLYLLANHPPLERNASGKYRLRYGQLTR